MSIQAEDSHRPSSSSDEPPATYANQPNVNLSLEKLASADQDYLWNSARKSTSSGADVDVQADPNRNLLWQSPIPVHVEKVDEFGACPQISGIATVRFAIDIDSVYGDVRTRDFVVDQSPEAVAMRNERNVNFLWGAKSEEPEHGSPMSPSKPVREFSGTERARDLLKMNGGEGVVFIECCEGKFRVALKSGSLCHVVLGNTVCFLIRQECLVSDDIEVRQDLTHGSPVRSQISSPDKSNASSNVSPQTSPDAVAGTSDVNDPLACRNELIRSPASSSHRSPTPDQPAIPQEGAEIASGADQMPVFYCLLVPSEAGAAGLLQVMSVLLNVDIREPPGIVNVGQTISNVGATTADGIVTAGSYAAQGLVTAANYLKGYIPRSQVEHAPEGEESPQFVVDPKVKEYAATTKIAMAQAAETASRIAASAHEKVAGGGAQYGRQLAYNNVKRNVQLGEEDAAEARFAQEIHSPDGQQCADCHLQGANLLPLQMPEIVDSSVPSSAHSLSEFSHTRIDSGSEESHEEIATFLDSARGKSCPAVIIDNYDRDSAARDSSGSEGEQIVTGTRVVAGAAIDSVMKVMHAFETAAWNVGRGVATVTTDLLEHRYGRDVGEFSRDVSDSIGGGVTTIRSGLSILPVPIALSAVQQAAKNDSLAQQAYSIVADEYKKRSSSVGAGSETSSSDFN